MLEHADASGKVNFQSFKKIMLSEISNGKGNTATPVIENLSSSR